MLRKTTSFILALLFCLTLLPAGAFAAPPETVLRTGNSDLNIRNGGVLLRDGSDLYFVQDGIFVQRGEDVAALSADPAKNLNLWNGYIYYTVGNELRRIPASGGARELVFAAGSSIDELYAVDGGFLFTMSGSVWKLTEGESTPERLPSPENVTGLIPTAYGSLFLTGGPRDCTLWAGETQLLSGLSACYTDSGYLAVEIDNQNYMVLLSDLFSGFDRGTDLRPFAIHGTASLLTAIGQDDDNTISEWNDNNELMLDFPALLREAGLTTDDAALLDETTASSAVPDVSQGQRNIVKRAHQLADYTWTPLANITQWGQRGLFYAGSTYTGIPYGQPVNTNGYVGYGVSLENYDAAMRDNQSKLYTTYSTYNKIAPYYSSDCSGYISWCWGLKNRLTTYSLGSVATKVGDQSVYSLQIGDILNETSSHVVLISDLTYDANGNIVGLEVMEETPVITRTTRYGQGESRSLASFQSYYLDSGYVIYRNPERDGVVYAASSVVQLSGESASSDPAPKCTAASVTGGKKLTLTASNGMAIYYTTDGSVPSVRSTKYTAPVTVRDGVTLRAVAPSGNYASSREISYTVTLPQTATPTASVSGTNVDGYISAGSTVSLSAASGATIHYTLDGSAPTSESNVYSGAITLTKDTTIKASASATGMRDSTVLTVSYKVGTFYTITASAGSGGSVSPSGNTTALAGSSKTFTITPASGYKLSSLTIDGAAVTPTTSYSFSAIAGNHTLKAAFETTASLPFTDVSQSAWYYKAVANAYAQDLFSGTSATTFSPDTAMTRGMFVTVLGRSAGLDGVLAEKVGLVTATPNGVNIRKGPSTDTAVVGFVDPNKNTPVQVLGTSSNWYQIKYNGVTGYIRNDLMKAYSGGFSDLASGQYYTAFAQWANLTGIASGTSFNANAAITREDMCLMLYNYARFAGKTIPANVSKATFSDDAAISSGARTAVYALQQASVISGMGNGSFSPKSGASRAQVAQIFLNFRSAVG